MQTQSGARVILEGGIRPQLIESARASSPGECCGALLGSTDFATHWEVEQIIELTNRSPRTEAEYLITSDDVRFAQRKARTAGLDVVGFFHSHPTDRSEPSAVDTERAWPGYTYLIIAGEEITAWTLDEERGQFRSIALEP